MICESESTFFFLNLFSQAFVTVTENSEDTPGCQSWNICFLGQKALWKFYSARRGVTFRADTVQILTSSWDSS